ncbi:hypothetical protein DSO57_1024505 [Entomophthora muscae]|uniref:Uncharacterized protein n=1 Tax=Entomophthora muscae TaxID=34485 RepID=A0ACC2T3I0_9FUNG|nr:hypothetical protein DSO57_1024505 [Entomophthora muscae]
MEFDDISSDFSIDFEELNAIKVDHEELKRKRETDLNPTDFPPGISKHVVVNSLPHKSFVPPSLLPHQ